MWRLLLIGMIVLGIETTLYCESPKADPFQKQEEFFNQNFAKDPLAAETEAPQDDNRDSVADNQKSIEQKDGSVKSRIEQARTGSASKKPLKSQPDQLFGDKILKVGVIFNGLNEEHTGQVMQQLNLLAKTKGLELGKVLLVADISAYGQNFNQLLPLELYGASADFISELPEKYAQVKSSPAWILETSSGELLVEGLIKINQQISEAGYFKENLALQAEEVKAIEPAKGGDF